MKMHLTVIGTLIGLVVLATAHQSVNAQPPDAFDPEAFARRCIRHVAELSEECAEQNAETARRCCRRIEALLAAGEEDAAAEVARRCIHRIHRQTEDCVSTIRRHCRRCVGVLEDLGEVELADAVREACDRALDHVRTSQRRAVRAIRECLGTDE